MAAQARSINLLGDEAEKSFDYLRLCLQRQVFAAVALALTVPKSSGAAYLFFMQVHNSFVFFFCGAVASFNFNVFLHRMCIRVSMYLCIHAHVFK